MNILGKFNEAWQVFRAFSSVGKVGMKPGLAKQRKLNFQTAERLTYHYLLFKIFQRTRCSAIQVEGDEALSRVEGKWTVVSRSQAPQPERSGIF